MYNIYLVKTNIKVKANTFLNINILELIVANVIRDTWNVSDLNPDYTEESKDNQEALPPADNI